MVLMPAMAEGVGSGHRCRVGIWDGKVVSRGSGRGVGGDGVPGMLCCWAAYYTAMST